MSDSEDEIFFGEIGLKEWKIRLNKPITSNQNQSTKNIKKLQNTIGISMDYNCLMNDPEDKENTPINFIQEVKNTLFKDEPVPESYVPWIEDNITDLGSAVIKLHKEIDEKLESTDNFISLTEDSTKYLSIKQESLEEVEKKIETIEILDETEDIVYISSEDEEFGSPLKRLVIKHEVEDKNTSEIQVEFLDAIEKGETEEKFPDSLENINSQFDAEIEDINSLEEKLNKTEEILLIENEVIDDKVNELGTILGQKKFIENIEVTNEDNKKQANENCIDNIYFKNVEDIEVHKMENHEAPEENVQNIEQHNVQHDNCTKLLNDSFEKLLQNESYDNYMINNEIKSLIDTIVVTDEEGEHIPKNGDIRNLSTIDENDQPSKRSSECFNDTLEEMEMFLKEHEKLKKQSVNNIECNEEEAENNSVSTETVSLIKEAKQQFIYPSTQISNQPFLSLQSCSQNVPPKRYFPTPTKTPTSKFKVPATKSVTKSSIKSPFKDIVSPVGLYIKTNQVSTFVRKNIGKEFVPKWDPLPDNSSLPSVSPAKQSPKVMELPMRYYRPAGRDVIAEKEDCQRIPENIQKLLKGAMDTELVEHDGRLKENQVEESFSAFDDTACLETDYDDISMLKSKKGVKF